MDIREDAQAEVFRSLSVEEQQRWLRAMEPIEPIRYIHLAAPAALFIQFGLKDQSVRVENARTPAALPDQEGPAL